jgi:uncharacterized membrane protein
MAQVAQWVSLILILDALLVVAIGMSMQAPGWNRLGMFLWLVAITLGGSFAVYSLAFAAQGAFWQLPAYIVACGVLVYAAERSRQQLASED